MDNQQGANECLRELALFAGAGGGILGGKLLGWRTVCAVEWDKYPASVLAARQNEGILPPFPIWDDVLKSCAIASLETVKWTRNINTAQRETALFAVIYSLQGIKIRLRNAAPMLVVGRFKRVRKQNPARFAGLSFYHQGRCVKPVHGNAERHFDCPEGRLIQWLKLEGNWHCFVAVLLLAALETKLTERRRYSAIQSRIFGRTLSHTLSQECHGTTTEKGMTNGA
jgi:hypothetical protein